MPRFDSALPVGVRDARLLAEPPWVRSSDPLTFTVTSEGWKFPVPPGEPAVLPPKPAVPVDLPPPPTVAVNPPPRRPRARVLPAPDTVLFKDRLLYLLQPPIEQMFVGRQMTVPFPPYPYQLEGIAFLMPRQAALLADEMGLGKTVQTILALRLLLQAGLVRRALLVCPKPLVFNWCRELRSWAEDLPFEVVGGGPPGGVAGVEHAAEDRQLRGADPRRRAGGRSRHPFRPGRPRRGPADQEPRVEDGPRGPRPAAVPELGADRHADRKQAGRPRQPVRLRGPRPGATRDASQDAAAAHCGLHPPPHQGGRARRHAAQDHPGRLPGADRCPAGRLRPGGERRRCPPQRTGRHGHGTARLRAGHAAQADLQFRPTDRGECQAGAAGGRRRRGGRKRPQGDRLFPVGRAA